MKAELGELVSLSGCAVYGSVGGPNNLVVCLMGVKKKLKRKIFRITNAIF